MHPFARSRDFWRLVADAVLLGLAAGALALAFVTVVGLGTNLWWPDDPDYDFLGGEPWWIAVTASAGLLVGWLRLVTRVPDRPYGARPRFRRRGSTTRPRHRRSSSLRSL